jgi:hypothetical protein
MPLPLRNKKRKAMSRSTQRSKATSQMKRFYNSGYGGTGVQRGSNGITNLVRPPRSLTPGYGGPFGQVFDNEVNYCDYFSMNPSAGAPTSTLFLANGIFDPTFALGGHQPHGYDYLSQLYDSWQVLSSTIEVVLYPQLAVSALINGSGFVNNQIIGSFMSIGVRDTPQIMTGSLTTLTDVLERPNLKTVFVNSNSEPTKIRASFSMPKFYGRARGMDDAEITGSTLADPNDKVYYHIIFGPNEGTTNLDSHQFVCRIKYKCRWFNPKNLVQS